MRCFTFRAKSPHGARYVHERFLRDTAAAQIEAARYSIALSQAGFEKARPAEPWTIDVTDSAKTTLFTLSFVGPGRLSAPNGG